MLLLRDVLRYKRMFGSRHAFASGAVKRLAESGAFAEVSRHA